VRSGFLLPWRGGGTEEKTWITGEKQSAAEEIAEAIR